MQNTFSGRRHILTDMSIPVIIIDGNSKSKASLTLLPDAYADYVLIYVCLVHGTLFFVDLIEPELVEIATVETILCRRSQTICEEKNNQRNKRSMFR